MTTALQAAESRIPGALVRAMADFVLKIKPELSRMALARRLQDRLASHGVRYNERTIRRQLNGDVSSVPALVEQEMRSLLVEIGSFEKADDIDQALISTGLWVPPEARRSLYIRTERLVGLVRLWLHFHPNRSRRFLARLLSSDLQQRGLRLTVDTLQPILAGKRRSARRELLEQLLDHLVAHGVTSEDSAQTVLQRIDDNRDSRFAGMEPVAAAEFHELAKVWQWRHRGSSKRKLANRLKQELTNRGITADFRRLQSLLSGAGNSGHRREYELLKSLVLADFRDCRSYDSAIKRVKSGGAVANDLEWVNAKPIADLAKSWLAEHPDTSARNLALRIKSRVKKLGYSVSLSSIQSLFANRTQRARGFIYRAMMAQFENNQRAKIPAEHILYPKHRTPVTKPSDAIRHSSKDRGADDARYRSADVLDMYLHEIGTMPRLSRDRENQLTRRIEQTESEIIAAIAGSDVGRRALYNLISRLRSGQQSARELLRCFDDEADFDQERYQNILQAIGSIAQRIAPNDQVLRHLNSGNQSELGDDALRPTDEQQDVSTARLLAKIKLSKRAIEQIASRIDRLIRLATKAEKEKQAAQHRLRVFEMKHGRLDARDGSPPSELSNQSHNSPIKQELLNSICDRIAASERRLRRIEKVAGVPIDRLRTLRKIQSQAELDSIRAMQKLIEANLPLVVWIARRHRQNGIALSDTIQEGNIGLIKALNRFDRRHGIRFSSYAFWWIRAYIKRAIDDQSRTIRISVPALGKIRSLRRIGYRYSSRLGRNATLEEVAEETDMPIEKVRALLESPNRTLSLDVPVYQDGSLLLGDLIADTRVVSPSETAATNQLRERIIESLSELTPRERTVVQMRYGLNETNDHTLREIGEALHLSRERIRQIETDALEKLRRLLERKIGNTSNNKESGRLKASKTRRALKEAVKRSLSADLRYG